MRNSVHVQKDASGERISCQHCRANSFPGALKCWQCGAALPAPDEIQAAARSAQMSAIQSRPPTASRGSARALQILALALIATTVCLLIVLTAMRSGSPDRQTAEPPYPAPVLPGTGQSSSGAAAATGPSGQQPPVREPGPSAWSVPPPQPTEATPHVSKKPATRDEAVADPVLDRARQEVDRARDSLSLPPPDSRESDRVRLKGGGELRREEWEAARRKLQESPLLRDPPSPSPF